jgi:hypothetical protein
MRTAINGAVRLDAMPNHRAIAVLATRRQSLDRTLETIKSMRLAGDHNVKRFVVIITTNFAAAHGISPMAVEFEELQRDAEP